MKQNRLIKKCGPYKVSSMSQQRGGLRIVIYPALPEYGDDWAITREKGEGGGPSIFTCIALAMEFEKFLNQHYAEEAITEWKETLEKALEKYNKLLQKRLDKQFERAAKQG